MLKNKLSKLSTGVLFALLVIQPLLDIISFWAQKIDFTLITTAFRLLMFVGVFVYAFIISDKKWTYVVFASVIAVYWIGHMIVCLKSAGGYVSPVGDASNFLRTVHLPMLAFAFITFFKKGDEVPKYVQAAFVINMTIMMHSVILSYMTRTSIFTYKLEQQGLIGWAAVQNAQSAILAVVVPLILLFAYRKKNKIAFYASALVCLINLFFVGTKVDYYSIFIVGAAFLAMLLITGEKQAFYYVTVGALLVTCLLCYKTSAVYHIRENHANIMDQRQSKLEDVIQDAAQTSSNAGRLYLPGATTREEYEQMNPLAQYRIHKLYNTYSKGLVSRFGFDRVFDEYNYTLNVSTLAEQRNTKRTFARLAWEDSSFLEKCFGYEYNTLVENVETTNKLTGTTTTVEHIFDLENDFPGVFYYSGYVGFALYLLFLIYFIALIFVAVVTRLKKVMTMENGMLLASLCIAFGAAQWSGNLLRRPNASIYISVVLAYIYYNTAVRENVKLTDIFHLGRFWKEAREESKAKKALKAAEKAKKAEESNG